MNEEEPRGSRYIRKMCYLRRTPGLQQERMEDLLRRIKANLPALKRWLLDAREWEQDGFYRFYRGSFKVFKLQDHTRSGFELIQNVGGEADQLNEDYCRIYEEGTRVEFNQSVNEHWLEETRPILEAFYHTRYFIQMMVRYGRKLPHAPQCLPSGWAAVLYLFELH